MIGSAFPAALWCPLLAAFVLALADKAVLVDAFSVVEVVGDRLDGLAATALLVEGAEAAELFKEAGLLFAFLVKELLGRAQLGEVLGVEGLLGLRGVVGGLAVVLQLGARFLWETGSC